MLPIKLELENFMSYDKAELDFGFSSALIVGETNGNERVSNGSGKSTILNAIEWALFGESRNKTADNVVRRGQLMCRVCFIFSHDDRTYRIIRTRNVRNSKMEVQFDELRDDGSVNELTHDTNKQTDAQIRRVVKSTHEVFINSSYFRQNSFFDFVQGTFSTRQAIVGSLLNLDKWSRYQDSAKEELKKLTEHIDRAKTEVDQLPAKNQRLAATVAETTRTTTAKETLATEEATIQDEIRALELKATESANSASNYRRYHEVKERLDSCSAQVASLKKSLAAKAEMVADFQNKAESNRKAAEELQHEITEDVLKLVDAQRPDLAKFETGIAEGRGQIKLLTQQLETLQSDSCLMCGHEWTDHAAKHAFVAERQIKKSENEAKLARAELKLKALKDEVEAIRKAELALEKKRFQKTKLDEAAGFAELRQKAAQEEEDAIREQLDVQEAKELTLKELLATIDKVEKTDLDKIEYVLNQRRQRLQLVRKQLGEANYQLGALAQEAKSLQELVAYLEVVKANLMSLTRKAAVYGQLAKAFSRDGIQAIILDNIVEELGQVANHWLGQLWTEPVYINFITQKKNTKGDWRETFELEFHTPTGVAQWEDFSGGEQFRISFAIRLALSIVQAKRMGGEIQLLMLDEVSTSLDPSGLEAFVSIIRRLEKEMKVLVISHDDKLKEEFEHIITVHKGPEGSTLSQN